MATEKKTNLEKNLTKFYGLMASIRTEQEKTNLDLPTRMLYKRLMLTLKSAESRIVQDKQKVDKVAAKRKKAAPKKETQEETPKEEG